MLHDILLVLIGLIIGALVGFFGARTYMKKYLNLRNLSLIISIAYIVCAAIFFTNLFKVNILPLKYSLGLIIITLLLLIISLIIIFRFDKKNE